MNLEEKIRLFSTRFKGSKLAIEWYDKDGRKQWAPYCHNQFDREKGCKKGQETSPCESCEIRDFRPWTEESIKRHVFGSQFYRHNGKRKSHGVYPLSEEGTINFGAIDFDDKHSFLDVRDFYEACKSYGFVGHVAKSTSKGWHIYFFMKEPVEAIKFRAIILFIMEENNFDWVVRPEIFPKQSFIGKNEFGNLIKPPMIIPQIKEGRNCFVDPVHGIPFGFTKIKGIDEEKQWMYLRDLNLISKESLDEIIELNNISVEIGNGSTGAHFHKESGPWNPPMTGDFHKVIQGCSTVKRIVNNPFAKEVQHEHRYAMAIIAVNCKNGIEHLRGIFKAKDGDWTKEDEIDEHGFLRGSPQIETVIDQAKKHNYKPWTCKRLKEIGACKNSKRCLERKQRHDTINGHLVPIEGEFVEPSPYRFAVDKNPGISVSDLIQIGRNCKGSSEEIVLNLFKENLDHIIKFQGSEAKLIMDSFSKFGKIKISTLKDALKEYLSDKKRGPSEDGFSYDGATYRVDKDRKRYIKTISTKDDSRDCEISNFLIDLKEIRKQKDGEGNEMVLYKGKFDTSHGKFDFTINQEDWYNRRKLPQAIGQITNGRGMVKEKYAEDLLISTHNFCDYKIKSVLTEFGYYGLQQNVYYSPSVVIDKNGIRPNDKEQDMDLSLSKLSNGADFTLVDEDELRRITKDFISDLSDIYEHVSLYPTLGYYFSIPIMGRLDKGTRQKPCLWLEGVPGTFKSTLARFLNCLWGNYKSGDMTVAWTSSYNSICKEGTYMKDLPFLIDDYKKSLVDDKIPSLIINNYYDETGRGTLRRDGTQNATRTIKGFLICTGEDPVRDSGTITRLILVRFNPVKGDQSKFDDLSRNKVETYKGITPHYIKYLYSFEDSDLHDQILEHQENFIKMAGGICDSRITKNMAYVSVGFKHFVGFLKLHGIITHSQSEKMFDEFIDGMRRVGDDLFNQANDNQTAHVFIENLGALITSNEVKIEGYNDDKAYNKTTVGFIEKNGNSPADEFVYIYRKVAISKVEKFLSLTKQTLVHGENTIAKQLEYQDLLAAKGKTRSTIRKRGPRGVTNVWKFRKKTLGMSDILRPVRSSDFNATSNNGNPLLYNS